MKQDLKEICRDIRCDIMTCIGHLGVGHVGGCLSVVEGLGVLYFEAMNVDPADPKKPGRDRFVCSKGHAGPAVYATLANRGYFDKAELLTLNQGGTHLPSHCDMNLTRGIDMTTGSLGQGFSCAVGAALGSKLEKDGATIYALIGDGESQEGQIWEAAMFASAKGLELPPGFWILRVPENLLRSGGNDGTEAAVFDQLFQLLMDGAETHHERGAGVKAGLTAEAHHFFGLFDR